MRILIFVLGLYPVFLWANIDSSYLLDRNFNSVETNLYYGSVDGNTEKSNNYTLSSKGVFIKSQYLLLNNIFVTGSAIQNSIKLINNIESPSVYSDGILTQNLILKAGGGIRKRYLSYFFGQIAKELEFSLEGSAVLKVPYLSSSQASLYGLSNNVTPGFEVILKYKRSFVTRTGINYGMIEFGGGNRTYVNSLSNPIVLMEYKWPLPSNENILLNFSLGTHNADSSNLGLGLVYAF